MEELTARRRADELNGIAVKAKWIANVGAWVLMDGQGGPRLTWIVISKDRRDLLDDGGAHEGSKAMEGYLDFEGRRIPYPLAIPDCSMDREAKLEDHLYVSHWPEDMARLLVELNTENEKLRERLEEGNKRIEHATALTGVLLERVDKVLAIPNRYPAIEGPHSDGYAEGYNMALADVREALGETE